MNTKKTKAIISLSLIVLGLIASINLLKSPQNISENAAPAASILILPSSQEVNLEKSFTSQVVIDSGENKVTGIDLTISFDPKAIKIDDIKPTSELSNFTSIIKNDINNNTGKISYASFTFDKNQGISGTKSILTIYGSIPYNATQGTYNLSVDNTSIIVAVDAGQNILSNISNGEIKIIGGVPNACGGTCGSNNNCQANYFCYIENGKTSGFCRNPVCQTDTNCDCKIEATATPKATKKTIATATPKATVKPLSSPTVTLEPKGGSVTAEPYIISTPTPSDEPSDGNNLITTHDLKNNVWQDFYKYLIGIGIITIFIVALFFAITNYKKNKTHIMPPTNI